MNLFKLLIPLILFFINSSEAEDCPKSAKEFVPWYTNLIDTHNQDYWSLANVSVFTHLCYGQTSTTTDSDGYLVNKSFGKGVEKLPPEDRWVFDACTGPAEKMAHTLLYADKVGITKKKNSGTRPLVLPPAFFDKRIRETLISKSATQVEIDKAIKALDSRLPSEARTFQYMSGTVHRTSYVTVLPSDKEDIMVHTHAEGIAYDVYRVNKKDADGKSINPPTIDFFQVDNGETHAQPYYRRCISCHRGGSVAILPEGDKFISHEPGVSGAEIKKWWNGLRPTAQDLSNYDMSQLGPSMGPSDKKTRTEEFIKKCASSEIPNLTPSSISKIRGAMNCTGCHEMEGRAEHLQFPMHTPDFNFRVFDNIILSGHMPKQQKVDLSMEERKALLKCLKYEFFGGLKDPMLSQGNPEKGILLEWMLPSTCKIESSPLQTESQNVGQ